MGGDDRSGGGVRKTEMLPSIGVLPQLKELEVERMDAICAVGPEFYGNTAKPFPALETLLFINIVTQNMVLGVIQAQWLEVTEKVHQKGIINSKSYLPVLPYPRSKLGVTAHALADNVSAALTS
ncbi:hypothetical protein CRG98_029153 [Punica granatum]|uniref:Uncharacterized protein n=1 Tax=Punica granatum TaxID=22663 RepID=A0A2I0J3F5_PUNGR|nr:hypothetical protein CRG98_029153 [Punica granatum]